MDKRKKEAHECGEYYCKSCETYVMDDHLCYLRSIPPKEEFIPKFIFLISNVARMREPSVRKGMC